ncbi:hypothetical protein [Trabulsiella odontotermitis]|uniref:hypothetical protein n=1 Tax=Trabulsiella odontotermitis TaxID=379893 RepID=UPI0012D76F04|nr:hypothetical protein [Trabulsiella odontotermitis]
MDKALMCFCTLTPEALPVKVALKIIPESISGSVKTLIRKERRATPFMRGSAGMAQGFNEVTACVAGTVMDKGYPL